KGLVLDVEVSGDFVALRRSAGSSGVERRSEATALALRYGLSPHQPSDVTSRPASTHRRGKWARQSAPGRCPPYSKDRGSGGKPATAVPSGTPRRSWPPQPPGSR